MNIELLEREHGEEVVSHLSQALHMPGVTLDEMCGAEAAFDLVPYAEAARRGCVALRNAEGALAVVLGIARADHVWRGLIATGMRHCVQVSLTKRPLA